MKKIGRFTRFCKLFSNIFGRIVYYVVYLHKPNKGFPFADKTAALDSRIT